MNVNSFLVFPFSVVNAQMPKVAKSTNANAAAHLRKLNPKNGFG